LRILMGLPDKGVRGGPPSHLFLLKDELGKQGVDVTGFIFGGRSHDEQLIPKLAGRLFDVLKFPFIVIRDNPDIIHLNSAYDEKGLLRDVFFVFLAKLMMRKISIKFHGSDLRVLNSKNPIWRLLTWFVIGFTDAIFLLSKEEMAQFYNINSKGHYFLVKNALDFNRYRSTFKIRDRFNLPSTKTILLFIARLEPEKGLRDVINALTEVLDRHEIHLVVVGDGPDKEGASALTAELNLDENVTFTGYIEEKDTANVYLQSDILVFPTYHQEGMPMVIFHSLACGLPIITTSIRAAADWLTDEKQCLFVEPKHPKSVARAISRLISDRELANQLAEEGKTLAEKFSKEQVASEFKGIYEQLLKR